MPFDEIFANPVVKQVAFEIRFPSLFFLEGRIGEFQIQVMREFPKSELAVQRAVVFAMGTEDKIEDALTREKNQDDSVTKVWRFTSETGVTLNVSHKALSIISESHKSYRLGDTPFRGVIKSVIDKFIGLVKIPSVERIGLRYIDECPVFDKTTARFEECYDSILPLRRFPIEQSAALQSTVVAQKEHCWLRYIEAFASDETANKLTLDFDAWTEKTPAEEVVATTDRLHATISTEFEKTIKQPIIDYMRKQREESHANA